MSGCRLVLEEIIGEALPKKARPELAVWFFVGEGLFALSSGMRIVRSLASMIVINMDNQFAHNKRWSKAVYW